MGIKSKGQVLPSPVHGTASLPFRQEPVNANTQTSAVTTGMQRLEDENCLLNWVVIYATLGSVQFHKEVKWLNI
jgi:hypothetical protein